MVRAENIRRFKRYMVGTGVFLLVGSFVALLLVLVGALNLPQELIQGESAIHSVARVAIVGCLLAAIGSLD